MPLTAQQMSGPVALGGLASLPTGAILSAPSPLTLGVEQAPSPRPLSAPAPAAPCSLDELCRKIDALILQLKARPLPETD